MGLSGDSRARHLRLPPGFEWVAWRSQSLQRQMSLLVHAPAPGPEQPSKRYPVLYLLHGSGHDPDSVLRDVQPQACIAELGEAWLIIPDGRQGWWIDSPVDFRSKYQTYLLELVRWVVCRYPTIDSPAGRGLCGFSMGGYGAMLLAARHPELFGAASSLLGPLDIAQWHPEYYRLRLLLGTDLDTWQEHNPTAVAAQLHNTPLLFSAGTGALDRLQNEAFATALRALGIAHEFRVYPGEHNTDFVRQHLASHFAFHRRQFAAAA